MALIEWEVIKMEGGEIRNREEKMPRKKENPILTYILVILILMVACAVIVPTQFAQFIDLLRSNIFGILILIAIALIAYLLGRS